MEPVVAIEIAGLTKLDQLELEKIPELKEASFEAQKAPHGQLGYLPLLTLTAHVPAYLIGAFGTGVAVWLAKKRTHDKIEISMAVTRPDGTKAEARISHDSKKSEGIESELVALAKQLIERHD